MQIMSEEIEGLTWKEFLSENREEDLEILEIYNKLPKEFREKLDFNTYWSRYKQMLYEMQTKESMFDSVKE